MERSEGKKEADLTSALRKLYTGREKNLDFQPIAFYYFFSPPLLTYIPMVSAVIIIITSPQLPISEFLSFIEQIDFPKVFFFC